MLECLGNIKINNNGKSAQKIQFKIGRKKWLKHSMKAVLMAFFEKQRYRKLNFFQCLNTIAMKILSPMNENFPLTWAHNLRVLNGILASKTFWICHWAALLEITFSLLFCLQKAFQRVLYERNW